MTDGERLVWAASYALALDRGRTTINAVLEATNAVTQLREAAVLQNIAHVDARDFVDEIVNVP